MNNMCENILWLANEMKQNYKHEAESKSVKSRDVTQVTF
jgi:hypothetical protein